MVPVDDTALYVNDTGGRGRPVIYLNGAYADQSHWRPVIADLGSDYRHITYDERARGKSKRWVDYAFEACLRDLDAILKARVWTGRWWWAGPMEASCPGTGLTEIRTASWEWCGWMLFRSV
jgi:pimeloyl-ACP methyl ester carboxylesterase